MIVFWQQRIVFWFYPFWACWRRALDLHSLLLPKPFSLSKLFVLESWSPSRLYATLSQILVWFWPPTSQLEKQCLKYTMILKSIHKRILHSLNSWVWVTILSVTVIQVTNSCWVGSCHFSNSASNANLLSWFKRVSVGIRQWHVAKNIQMSSLWPLWQVIRSYALDPTPKLYVKVRALSPSFTFRYKEPGKTKLDLLSLKLERETKQ